MYPDMYDFFAGLRGIAAANPTNMPSRNRQIQTFLEAWMKREVARRVPAEQPVS
jgi:hypothetical protein